MRLLARSPELWQLTRVTETDDMLKVSLFYCGQWRPVFEVHRSSSSDAVKRIPVMQPQTELAYAQPSQSFLEAGGTVPLWAVFVEKAFAQLYNQANQAAATAGVRSRGGSVSTARRRKLFVSLFGQRRLRFATNPCNTH